MNNTAIQPITLSQRKAPSAMTEARRLADDCSSEQSDIITKHYASGGRLIIAVRYCQS